MSPGFVFMYERKRIDGFLLVELVGSLHLTAVPRWDLPRTYHRFWAESRRPQNSVFNKKPDVPVARRERDSNSEKYFVRRRSATGWVVKKRLLTEDQISVTGQWPLFEFLHFRFTNRGRLGV
jgi:hypothetical protein